MSNVAKEYHRVSNRKFSRDYFIVKGASISPPQMAFGDDKLTTIPPFALVVLVTAWSSDLLRSEHLAMPLLSHPILVGILTPHSEHLTSR
jgi:hypothetical protein